MKYLPESGTVPGQRELFAVQKRKSCDMSTNAPQVTDGDQVPVLSLRDIVDFMRKNEASFPHFRNSATYKLFEPLVFENKKKANGYWF